MDQFQSQAPQSAGDTGEPQFVMPPKNHTKLWLVVIILAVAAVVVGIYLKAGNKESSQLQKQQEQPKPVVTDKLPEGYKATVLEKGKYPEGFPMEAVVKEGDPVWQRSEDTLDGAGMRHRVVDLLYTKNSSEVITNYKTVLSKLGWIIEQENNSQDTLVVVFFKKGASASDDQKMVVVCSVSQKAGESLASLQYLTKN